MIQKEKINAGRGDHTVKIDGGDEDDNDDILVFGVPVHAFVSEVCFSTTMVVMAIIVAVVGGGCKKGVWIN